MANGERTIRIRFDGSAKGLAAASAAARAQLKGVEQAADRFVKKSARVATGAAKIALAMSALSGGASLVMGVASALATASGAAGVLPGVLFMAAGALAAVKLGADGAWGW